MLKKHLQLQSFTLVGIQTRTCNADEMQPETAKIGLMMQTYWGLSDAILHKAQPGLTYAVYTDYDSDEHGDYTYFIGTKVSSLENQDLSQFQVLDIPCSDYLILTPDAGAMPGVVIKAWQTIWSRPDLRAQRAYQADFEIYDERAQDPNNATLDIYLSVNE